MTSETLKRILSSVVFPNDKPWIIPPGPARREALESLKRLVFDAETYIGEWSGAPILVIKIQVEAVVDERHGQPFDETLAVGFRGDRVSLGPNHHFEEQAVPLGGTGQFITTVAEVRKHLESQARQGLKRGKLRHLGMRAVEGKIEALVARQGCSYYVDWLTRSFRLVVAIDEDRDDAILFQMPYADADERLAQAERVITEVRRLYALGARCKMYEVNPEMLGRPKPTSER